MSLSLRAAAVPVACLQTGNACQRLESQESKVQEGTRLAVQSQHEISNDAGAAIDIPVKRLLPRLEETHRGIIVRLIEKPSRLMHGRLIG